VSEEPTKDDDREVDLSGDDVQILPDQTRDDTDRGWGERRRDDSNDDRLLRERPPHWD
jgi:DNA-binding ferritin-like protein (Dps family)